MQLKVQPAAAEQGRRRMGGRDMGQGARSYVLCQRGRWSRVGWQGPFVALVKIAKDFIDLHLNLLHVPRELNLLVALLEGECDLLTILPRPALATIRRRDEHGGSAHSATAWLLTRPPLLSSSFSAKDNFRMSRICCGSVSSSPNFIGIALYAAALGVAILRLGTSFFSKKFVHIK